jgi:glycosyltransferase involved in cell wall biosynthesis
MPRNVAVIDPSLFTVPYDSALCTALLGEGWNATLYGRKPRANEVPPNCVPIQPFFYRLSERLRGHVNGLPLKLVKGVEHYGDMARLWGQFGERSPKPDVIHFQWTPLPAIDRMMIGSFAKISPVVLTVHDITPFNNSPGSGLQKLGAFKILKAFDHLIVHSDSSRETLIGRGIAPHAITTIPHGVLSIAKSAAERVNNPGLATILLFGNLKPYKGADVLIDAFGRLPDHLRRQARVMIVGQPHFDLAPLKQRALDLGVAEQIIWDSRYLSNAELAAAMEQADIFVFPYRDIDTSGVLMSCFPYGKPIIASNIGAFATLIRDGIHGHLVPPNDADALATAVARLIRDPFAREQYGRNVVEIAGTVPTWAEIASRTIAIYEKLLMSGIRSRRRAVI